ncbi:MAG: hypothetical protein EBU54_05585 [Mycobacteriaceae bacterium]|nr:hypothetical protein [Mycobacteriaceae bacterium]
MEVIILHDTDEIAAVAADAIESLLRRKPTAVLGLATGSSPLRIYDELAARCAAGKISFKQARGFTLDEYVGLPADHPESYRNVIDTVFVSRVDFAPGAVQGPDGLAEDIPAACASYEQAIADCGIDLQILGIGTDGHIGFNEPGSTALWPASVLQHHPHATVLLDEAAARRLQLADYYRETYRSKPEWQGI